MFQSRTVFRIIDLETSHSAGSTNWKSAPKSEESDFYARFLTNSSYINKIRTFSWVYCPIKPILEYIDNIVHFHRKME